MDSETNPAVNIFVLKQQHLLKKDKYCDMPKGVHIMNIDPEQKVKKR